MDRGGIEHTPESSGNRGGFAIGGAKSGAVESEMATLADPDLARLVAVWPTLSNAVKSAIIDLIDQLKRKAKQ